MKRYSRVISALLLSLIGLSLASVEAQAQWKPGKSKMSQAQFQELIRHQGTQHRLDRKKIGLKEDEPGPIPPDNPDMLEPIRIGVAEAKIWKLTTIKREETIEFNAEEVCTVSNIQVPVYDARGKNQWGWDSSAYIRSCQSTRAGQPIEIKFGGTIALLDDWESGISRKQFSVGMYSDTQRDYVIGNMSFAGTRQLNLNQLYLNMNDFDFGAMEDGKVYEHFAIDLSIEDRTR